MDISRKENARDEPDSLLFYIVTCTHNLQHRYIYMKEKKSSATHALNSHSISFQLIMLSLPESLQWRYRWKLQAVCKFMLLPAKWKLLPATLQDVTF